VKTPCGEVSGEVSDEASGELGDADP
jgi:hypothetical protein